MNTILSLVQNQREYFNKNTTLDVSFRKRQLQLLLQQIKKYEQDILDALHTDLHKSSFEAYACELSMVYEELRYFIKNITKLTKPKRKRTTIIHFPTKNYTYHDPYGCVLIISPWNYPFQLCITPLIGAIAAGNCAILKPSEFSVNTANVIEKILSIFNKDYIAVVQGGRSISEQLLNERFDYIMFTGSPKVGKIVMQKAANHLTPVTLELGGKSPCVVDNTANVDLTAKRIIWGKLLNAGQTCVAPDYVLVHADVKQALVERMHHYVKVFFGEFPHKNNEYPKIITQHHFDRLCTMISNEKNIEKSALENYIDRENLKISPFIFQNTSWESELMQEELFGPILPVLSFDDIREVVQQINKKEKPLALYLFTTSKATENYVMRHAFFGGGCINDTVIHVANHHLPFGGVGNSGMGNYHGEASFSLFSHVKSISKKANWLDINIRYAPYKDKIKVLKKL